MKQNINCPTFKEYVTSKELSNTIFDLNGRFSYHWGNLYTYYFEEIFSAFSILTNNKLDSPRFIAMLKDKYQIPQNHIIQAEIVSNSNGNDGIVYDDGSEKAFIIIQHGLAVCIDWDRVLIMYNKWTLRDEATTIAEMTGQFKKPMKKKKEFFMVTREDSNQGYELSNFEVKEYDISIEDNYNDDFKTIHEVIEESLSDKKKNGLILLHGKYGSGKTYYIRHLISTMEKKFIYLPHHMIGWITDPSFLPYMAKQQNAVIILEDCEDILMHREDGNQNATALSNLLNLGDGLLSDALSLNIICSFNANLKKIDDALLRKGRLIARYEFNELEVHKAQHLANKLEKSLIIDKPMTLSDIYNIEDMKFENSKTKIIGFKYA
ncbi:MAG: AAA family ATPase [Bacteroidota bacterium]